MAGTVKKLQFSEGTDVGAPTDLGIATSTIVISAYANDAAYVSANGAAIEGSVYLNSTIRKFRHYVGAAWRNSVNESDPTDSTKTFLVDVSGNTTAISASLVFAATANRSYTFPDASDTVILRTVTQILTNKELTSPLLQTPLIKGATKSIDVDAAANLSIGASVGANTITLGGASSTVVVAGSLQLDGSTTVLNSTTVDTTDPNITVNKGGNDASSAGAGITVDRTSTKGSIIYASAATSRFKIGDLASEVEIATISGAQVITLKDIDGGTATNTSRITLPKAATATLTALTRKQGTLLYDSTTDQVKYDNGSVLAALASSSAATPTAAGVVTSYFATIQSAVKSVASADYVVLTTDGFEDVLVTTGASDRTITLPAAASNTGRKLSIVKVDSGAGGVIIDGNASETVDGALTQKLYYIYGKAVIACDGTSWYSVSPIAESGTFAVAVSNGTTVTLGAQSKSMSWLRIGNVITCSGLAENIDPSAASSNFHITVPIARATNFASGDGSGGGWDQGGNSPTLYGWIASDTGNATQVKMHIQQGSTAPFSSNPSAFDMAFHFTYRLIT